MREPRRKLIRFYRKSVKLLRSQARQVVKVARRRLSIKSKPQRKARDNSQKLRKYGNLNPNKTRYSKKELKRRRRAEYLASLPKHPLKRLLYRLHPKRLLSYWFSRRGLIMALKITGVMFLLGVVTLGSLFLYFRKDLPDPRNLVFEQSTQFYDRTGKTVLFSVYGDENRTIVEFDQISDYVKWATIALEDKNFYKHGGFSVSAVIRAAIANLLNKGQVTQGGSTITQQFIKNSLVGNERTLTRKIKELILAVELERLYSKDEILGFYLNEIPYGSLEYGIEAAARGFFDKSAKDLTIDEAALLASLPQAPSLYSPYGKNTDLLVERQHFTIKRMLEDGYITEDEANKAMEVDTLAKIVPINQRSQYRNVIAPHFVDEVLKQLKAKYGLATLKEGGLKVITTLDLNLQKVAEKAMRDNFKYVQHPQNGVGSGGDNAAISVTDVETGQVVAQVGSRDYFFKGYGSFNAATSVRQPGSSFKPFAYSQLFYNPRWSPGSIIWDSPVTKKTFNGYMPNDFDFKFPGPMKIREAIGRSRNIPAVKALYMAGVDETVELARAMGNKSLNAEGAYLSLVLGAGEVKLAEHTHAYSTFARGGIYKPQSYILKVENSDGEVLEEWRDTPGEQVLDPQIAYLMTDILSDDQARSGTFGLNNPRLVVPGLVHTVKTGTTDRSRDGWMMGYTTCLAVGVWAGNHDNKPMDTITSWQTGPMWTQVMREAHKIKKYAECGKQQFSRPEGIKSVKIDRDTGRNASPTSKHVFTDIAASWFKGVAPDDGTKVVIDTVSNKLATECTPERAKKEITSSGIAPELPPDDPLFEAWAETAGYSATGTDIKEKDDIHKCTDVKPGVNNIVINKLIDGLYEISADISQGDFNLDTLNFKVNGNIVSSRSINAPGNYSYTYTATTTGKVNFSVEVIDEVLYSAEASLNDYDVVAFSAGINFLRPPTPTDGGTVSSTFVTIDWEDVSGADSYEICYKKDSIDQSCTTKTTSTYTLLTVPGSDYLVTVDAKLGGTTVLASGQTSFTRL